MVVLMDFPVHSTDELINELGVALLQQFLFGGKFLQDIEVVEGNSLEKLLFDGLAGEIGLLADDTVVVIHDSRVVGD